MRITVGARFWPSYATSASTLPESGLTYQGTINPDGSMTLVQFGGAQNGRTWNLRYAESF